MDAREVGVKELRANLADNLFVAVSGEIIYITSNGRRIAALVPLEVANAAH